MTTDTNIFHMNMDENYFEMYPYTGTCIFILVYTHYINSYNAHLSCHFFHIWFSAVQVYGDRLPGIRFKLPGAATILSLRVLGNPIPLWYNYVLYTCISIVFHQCIPLLFQFKPTNLTTQYNAIYYVLVLHTCTSQSCTGSSYDFLSQGLISFMVCVNVSYFGGFMFSGTCTHIWNF